MRDQAPTTLVELDRDSLEERGLYEILRANNVVPKIAHQTIGARAATVAEARALHENRGAPLLTMQHTAYDAHGRAVEHGKHVYRASLCSFELVLTRR